MLRAGILAIALTASSFLLTYLIIFLSLKKKILDIPNERSSHTQPTPRGGGLAFIIVFYVSLILLWRDHFIANSLFVALLGGIPVASIGYCDDLFGVKNKWRALIQILSAIWGLVWLKGIPSFYFGIMHFHAPILFFVIALIVTVWFINLYNFMDGADGLAGLEAIFVGVSVGGLLFLSGFLGEAYLCGALAFSVLGFLILNWSPAKIFMGDVGSGFLGYIFAILMWSTNNHHQLPSPVWGILFAVFFADASFTLIHRIWQRKRWWSAHREHVYQLMIQHGWTHRQLAFSILLINIMICLPLAITYLYLPKNVICPFLISFSGVLWLTWFLIRKNKYNMASDQHHQDVNQCLI